MMRRLARILLPVAVLGAAGSVCAVSIERVTTRHFEGSDFLSIGEYFTGEENQGARTVLRTDASRRDGYYLVIEFDAPLSSLPRNASVVLRYIRASDGAEETLRLPLPDERRGSELLVGLTGPDFAVSESPLLAWRVAVEDGAGRPLADYQSFLWELPE